MNPTHAKMLNYFEFHHLPERLQQVSAPFRTLAEGLVDRSERGEADPAETTAGLRKLVEAKDCAVRACL